MKKVFESENKDGEISVVFIDDDGILKLNREYRCINRPTDVLSFALNQGDLPDPQPGMWGDIVISVETAARQAVEAGDSFENEITRLLIHGALHLLGYDHEISMKEAARMRVKERKIISSMEKG
ncbi:MAG: rRNA maturation RNase YbeY [bacterium]